MSKLWGSRFDGKSDSLADAFGFSISYDYRLAYYDVVGSIAHTKMLGKCDIIPLNESKKIVTGLEKLRKQIVDGKFEYDPTAEDIHTDIQQKLKKLVGNAADRLHTARSRNDLIVLDMKLYCLEELDLLVTSLDKLQKAILSFAEKNIDVIIPAYTHLQSAQLVLLAHHMLAYIEMIDRDKTRVLDCLKRMCVNPLGSCALSGSSLPTDREMVTKYLGFSSTSANSMDSVSDRDFIIETLSTLSMLAVHFSRISEDLIIWASSEFNFIDIDWSLCTGSSIMPHKKNPDMLELIRGEAATIIGNLNKVLILLKGLPLTYNRDLQLDKPPLFESIEKTSLMVPILEKLFSTLKIKPQSIENKIQGEHFYSVDIMEYLIAKGVTYRDAHDTVGKMIKQCVDKGNPIAGLSKSELKSFHPKLEEDVKKLFNPQMSVKIKKSIGSTNPTMVKKQITLWNRKLT